MKNFSDILILLASYITLLLLVATANKIRPGITSYQKVMPTDMSMLNGLHTISILIMMLPIWTINTLPVFFLAFPDKISIGQAIAFLMSFGFIGFFRWKKFYTQLPDNSSMPSAQVGVYAGLRILFLLVYEWFFRGLLLVNLCNWVGNGLGIAINVLLYVAIHFHKNRKELIGCIPLGVLLCVFTLWCQSIWPAIIFHLQISIINEWPPLQQFISLQKRTAL